jgi:hypothetical protein
LEFIWTLILYAPLLLSLPSDYSKRFFLSTVFVVGPVITGPTTNTERLSPRYEGKTRGCHCSHWAPNDGRGKRPKHVEL